VPTEPIGSSTYLAQQFPHFLVVAAGELQCAERIGALRTGKPEFLSIHKLDFRIENIILFGARRQQGERGSINRALLLAL